MKVQLGGLPMDQLAATVQAALGHTTRAQFIDVTASPTADTPFNVYHSLGETPRFFSWMSNSEVVCRANDQSSWGPKQISIICNTANARLVVKVEA